MAISKENRLLLGYLERRTMDLTGATFTEHAVVQMNRRDVDPKRVRAVLANPEEVQNVRPGRVVVHGMDGKRLLRVFVDVDREPPAVVTVYRTSKVDKYRGRP